MNISKNLYELIKQRVEELGGEFKSIEEYVEFVLREIVKEDGEQKKVYSKKDEEEVKKRLESLGYM